MSEREKITDEHRRRRAVVYVRQSTLGQVERNTESAERQYALRERAAELGWRAEAIAVVDDDTGRSGASVEGRLALKGAGRRGRAWPGGVGAGARGFAAGALFG